MEIEKLYPTTKSYIWGGSRLFKYGKVSDSNIIAESWEVSFHDDGPSKISNGQFLRDIVTCQDLGKKCDVFPFFPILNKFIDAKDNLSLQVHPSDEYALKNENSFGKTEMWYVVDADKGACLYIGFNKNVSDKEIQQRIKDNSIIEIMNKIQVKPGDCYFIPAGTIHAIGKGCFIYEIQENSNLTYRVYDYDRIGKDGKKRELHIDKALKVLNKEKFIPQNLKTSPLVSCKYFVVNKVVSPKEIIAPNDSFLVFTIIKGNGKVNDTPAKEGETFFIPANKKATLSGNLELITTHL